MIVVDANFLVLLLDPPEADTTGLDRGHERVQYAIEQLGKSKTEIMIPTAVVSEIVAGRVDRVAEIMDQLRPPRFIIQDFDLVIAIETGVIMRREFDSRRPEDRPPHWKAMAKFDAMVAATAIVRRADRVYTHDKGIRRLLVGSGIECVMLEDLPYPPEPPQPRLPHVDP
ncbi:type II toxin-antitoxin system VapC family toxin [Oharaeibacter diazotrophicus]|uniref:type II toxin-antitoxin system VapC family toxin n=1 Tax=Oharaeibacter diazotrophicus TaxID=1920512 RepID=UPI000DC7AAA5|nr:PIN domain-containing protein [Oharaeibacter diazotrophicus]BBE74934.1 PIN domain protein [Pleomorphomonas sp. SM30]GLS79224.1 hypothetical protein GCM10007904_45620 [Oharaeibacter diazotrophicus]